jgi:DNA repair protein RadC
MNDSPQHYFGHRQRLRERFMKSDGDTLPDYELLELILFAAKPRGDVKPLAKKLLKEFGSFTKVFQASESELRAIDGVGDAAISTLKSVRCASQRMLKEEIQSRPIIQSWSALMDYCQLVMGHNKIEEFRVLFLNHKHHLIADEVMQRGTVNHTAVYPREIIKRALEIGASALILLHNHPSGDPSPSKADISMTEQIVTAAKAVNIIVHDHVIISQNAHYSFKSFGLI